MEDTPSGCHEMKRKPQDRLMPYVVCVITVQSRIHAKIIENLFVKIKRIGVIFLYKVIPRSIISYPSVNRL